MNGYLATISELLMINNFDMESEVIYKVCDICQKNKPVWEFRVNKKYEDGFNYHCKECRGKVNDYLKQKK